MGILLLGNAAAGKTTMVKRLIGDRGITQGLTSASLIAASDLGAKMLKSFVSV